MNNSPNSNDTSPKGKVMDAQFFQNDINNNMDIDDDEEEEVIEINRIMETNLSLHNPEDIAEKKKKDEGPLMELVEPSRFNPLEFLGPLELLGKEVHSRLMEDTRVYQHYQYHQVVEPIRLRDLGTLDPSDMYQLLDEEDDYGFMD